MLRTKQRYKKKIEEVVCYLTMVLLGVTFTDYREVSTAFLLFRSSRLSSHNGQLWFEDFPWVSQSFKRTAKRDVQNVWAVIDTPRTGKKINSESCFAIHKY